MAGVIFHPIADLFPLMEGREFDALVADIRENGLQNPIWLDATGRIVDGRNRYRACILARVEPTYRTWEGDESTLPAFIASQNLHRRHLSEKERAFIGGKIANMKRGDAAKVQARDASGKVKPYPPVGGNGQKAKPLVSQAQAAAVMQVPHRAVERAAVIMKHAPELERKVIRGEVSLSAAAAEAASRARGEPARKPLGRKVNGATATLYDRGIADLRRWVITYSGAKRFAAIAEPIREFLREQEKA